MGKNAPSSSGWRGRALVVFLNEITHHKVISLTAAAAKGKNQPNSVTPTRGEDREGKRSKKISGMGHLTRGRENINKSPVADGKTVYDEWLSYCVRTMLNIC